MKVQTISFLLIAILMLTSISVFGNDAVENQTKLPLPVSQNVDFYAASKTIGMEYCTVDLDDASSNLNVRTWEGRVITKLRHGTQVWISDYSGDWAKVSVKRGRRLLSIGWVDSNYLLC